jgi:hypothetical protein
VGRLTGAGERPAGNGRDGRPAQTYSFYELPEEWRLVP